MSYAPKPMACVDATSYYHVVARCVRRGRVWRFDAYAGGERSHRKAWVVERLGFLSSIFAIDICAYAVTSDHYRLVLHVDRERICACSSDEIVDRWSHLYRVPSFTRPWMLGLAGAAEAEIALAMIEYWRTRLVDVGWFMRCLNESLAHRANTEERCTRRLWSGRFKVRALLDETEHACTISSASGDSLIAHGCFVPLELARPLHHCSRARAPRTQASMLLPSGSSTNAP